MIALDQSRYHVLINKSIVASLILKLFRYFMLFFLKHNRMNYVAKSKIMF